MLFIARFFPDPRMAGLAVGKAFYLFFFSAFGSLFPLMGVYFKQLGMDAAQAGMLAGIRPIIEYLATPFWSKISDRFQKGKIMLLIAVASWIIFTLPIGFIHPPVVSCKYWNGTNTLLKLPNMDHSSTYESGHEREKRDVVHPRQMSLMLTPDTVSELPRALPLEALQTQTHQR